MPERRRISGGGDIFLRFRDELMTIMLHSNLEPSLAKRLANGELDPITLLPIGDINPGFVPRVSKLPPLHFDNLNRPSTDKGKGKAEANQGTVGLLHFFCKKHVGSLVLICHSPHSSSSAQIRTLS